MIADKAAVVVNTVFGQSTMYKGTYVFVAGILYSIQLYADFMACVTLAKGAAMLFGTILPKLLFPTELPHSIASALI